MTLVNGRLLALNGYKEIIVNSSLKMTQKKMALVLSNIQVSDPGPFWPSCKGVVFVLYLRALVYKSYSKPISLLFI